VRRLSPGGDHGDAQGRTVVLTEPFRLSSREFPMSDKSPRKTMSKKSGKSIKEKRAEKRGSSEESSIVKESPQGKKR
jgi:hypothetical protein